MRLFRQRPPDVPPWWADEIYKRLGLVLRNQETIMTQVEDLNAAVSSLAKGYGDLHTAVVKQTDALTEAMKNVAQPDPATSKAISDAIANITGITGKMATDAAELTSTVPGATTVDAPQVTEPASEPTADMPSIDPPAVTDPNATPPNGSSSSSQAEDMPGPAASSVSSAPQI
jgi:hypothetical protein